jgi:hypothetical protein
MSHTLFFINSSFKPISLKLSVFLCFSGWNKCSSSCNIKTRVWCHILWQWHKIWTLQQPLFVMETLMQHDIYRETYRYSACVTFQLYAQVVGLYLSIHCCWRTCLLHISNFKSVTIQWPHNFCSQKILTEANIELKGTVLENVFHMDWLHKSRPYWFMHTISTDIMI